MKLGWGKPVQIPPHPVYIPPALAELTQPPPRSGLPFNAQLSRSHRRDGLDGVPKNKQEMDKVIASTMVMFYISFIIGNFTWITMQFNCKATYVLWYHRVESLNQHYRDRKTHKNTDLKKYYALCYFENSNSFYWTNSFFTSLELRTSVFHLDCSKVQKENK